MWGSLALSSSSGLFASGFFVVGWGSVACSVLCVLSLSVLFPGMSMGDGPHFRGSGVVAGVWVGGRLVGCVRIWCVSSGRPGGCVGWGVFA